jgi:hypothetical protein
LTRRPLSRSADLIIEELGEELLVYDTRNDRGHSLSPTAAKVWQRCDGRTPANGLSAQLGLDAEAVEQALAELDACELLEAPAEPTLDVVHNGGGTRRELAGKAAKLGVGVAAGSLILSRAVPAAAQAQTIIALCAALNPGGNCGTCSQNECCCCTPGTNNPAATQRCAATFALCCAYEGQEDGNVSTCAQRGGNGQCEGATSATDELQSSKRGGGGGGDSQKAPASPEPTPAPETTAPEPVAPSPQAPPAPATGPATSSGTTTTPAP